MFFDKTKSKDVASTKTRKRTFTNQSDSAVCITPRSRAPQCASLRGVKLRSVHHTEELSSAVCITLQSQTEHLEVQNRILCESLVVLKETVGRNLF